MWQKKKKKKEEKKTKDRHKQAPLALGAGWQPWLLLQMETPEDRLPSVSAVQSTILAEQHMNGRQASPLFLRPRACLRE